MPENSHSTTGTVGRDSPVDDAACLIARGETQSIPTGRPSGHVPGCYSFSWLQAGDKQLALFPEGRC